jgi:hypothetical protein
MRPPPTVVDWVLVEPGVYWRIFSLDYQAERFEIFHQAALTRWVHYLGTQGILASFFLLSWGHQVGPVPVPLVLGLVLSAWYLRLQWLVGVVASVQLLVVAVIVAGFAARLGWGAREAGILMVTCATALNLSHTAELVPPLLTGRGFETLSRSWAHATWPQRLRLVALNGFYLPLEVVSAPRLFPVHVLRALHRLGWRRAWAADVSRRAQAVLVGVAP